MISIPLYIFLAIYALFLLVFIFFFFANFFHLFHTGGTTHLSFIVSVMLMALAALVIFATWYLVRNVDWQQTLDIGGSTTNIFNPTY